MNNTRGNAIHHICILILSRYAIEHVVTEYNQRQTSLVNMGDKLKKKKKRGQTKKINKLGIKFNLIFLKKN